MIPSIVADSLYSLSFRPQELSLYAEKVAIGLRYGAIFDEHSEFSEHHYKLLVIEFSVTLEPDDALAEGIIGPLELLKCGWELELQTVAPCLVGTIEELPEEAPLLLGRIAETVNDLARRAKLEMPFTPELVATLLAEYRSRTK